MAQKETHRKQRAESEDLNEGQQVGTHEEQINTWGERGSKTEHNAGETQITKIKQETQNRDSERRRPRQPGQEREQTK